MFLIKSCCTIGGTTAVTAASPPGGWLQYHQPNGPDLGQQRAGVIDGNAEVRGQEGTMLYQKEVTTLSTDWIPMWSFTRGRY